jgi:hypothetical protein
VVRVLNDAPCQVRRYGGTRDAAQLMTTGVLAAGQHTTHGALFRFRVRMLSLQHTSVRLSAQLTVSQEASTLRRDNKFTQT